MQLNFFVDYGSAWTGPNPFSTDNSYNKYTVGSPGSAFEIDVLNYRDPFVASFGTGVRTLLFNTILKADIGWGLEDYKLQRPMVMITLGSDF